MTLTKSATSSGSMNASQRPFREAFGNIAFAGLIFAIIALMPFGVLYDLWPRRGLKHRRRIQHHF